MILWLDHRIFGNGFGLGAPFWDQRYFWLTQNHLRGELYTYMGGLGAQLHSIQWTHPKAGERRHLSGYEFKVVHSTRRWCRVMVAWGLTRLPEGIDAANEMIRQVERDLAKNG